ncbi:MAG: histidine kinase, partial [Crocinitomicaceae bacterium]|nr:histidine kinase [Crocinitomicaceae bacterium]
MNRRNILYWICQAGGWGLFVLGNFVIASMQEQPFGRIAVLSALIFLMGIGTTHVFRNFIKKRKWARLNIL